MSFTREFISDLKFRNNISDVIGTYVPVKRIGKNLKCVCPFHNETDASLVIYVDSQSFYCFGCQAAGDVISFVMKIENIDYPAAVESLAAKAGLEIPKRNIYEEKQDKKRKTVLELNKKAARFYHERLISPDGMAAREYLKERKIAGQTVKKFGLGFAPEAWDELSKFFEKEGYTPVDMVDSGLCVRGKSGNLYDRFRARLMVPIIDIRGDIIAFGGRLMAGDGPKYLNSSDSSAFKKSRNLFAMNFAKMSKENYFILCEGYMDAISLHQAGFDSSVACLGTALTKEQAYLISGYKGEVLLCYDSDNAGKAAAEKAIVIFDKLPTTVRVIALVGAKDPDEYLKKQGADRFKSLINKAPPAIDYLLASKKAEHDITKASEKAAYSHAAVDILARLSDEVTAEIYAGKLAEELGLELRLLLSELRSVRQKGRQTPRRQEQKTLPTVEKLAPAYKKAERELIAIFYKNPDKKEELLKIFEKTGFPSLLGEEIFSFYSESDISMDRAREKLSEKAYSYFILSINQYSHNPLDFENIGKLSQLFLELDERKTKKELKNMEYGEFGNYMEDLIKKKSGGESI